MLVLWLRILDEFWHGPFTVAHVDDSPALAEFGQGVSHVLDLVLAPFGVQKLLYLHWTDGVAFALQHPRNCIVALDFHPDRAVRCGENEVRRGRTRVRTRVRTDVRALLAYKCELQCSADCRKARRAEQAREWWRENYEAYYKPYARVATGKRRALMRGSAVLDDVDVRVLLERDRRICHLCGKKVNATTCHPHPDSPTVDHLVPVTRGGDHSYANTALAHLGCNMSKGNRGGGEQLRLLG